MPMSLQHGGDTAPVARLKCAARQKRESQRPGVRGYDANVTARMTAPPAVVKQDCH